MVATAVAAAVTTAVGAPGLARVAHADVEIGGTAGVRVFNEDSSLGVRERPDAESQHNTALFGLRLGAYSDQTYGAEAEVGLLPSEGRSALYTVWNLTYRAQLIVQLQHLRATQLPSAANIF